MASITVSIVSHGHDAWLGGLLQQLAEDRGRHIARVVLTHNLPATALFDAAQYPFQLTEIHNAAPIGFGANHNQAFTHVDTPQFCILNPDMALPDPRIWPALVQVAATAGTGCAYPTLLNPDGSQQDNARAAPTPWALLRRRLLRRADLRVDWASGAFWLVPSPVYRALAGFDERYFLYCEDVDFCLRLQLAGWHLAPVPQARAVHDAQRRSLRGGQHLRWHIASLLRLWCSPVLLRYVLRRRHAD